MFLPHCCLLIVRFLICLSEMVNKVIEELSLVVLLDIRAEVLNRFLFILLEFYCMSPSNRLLELSRHPWDS